MTLTELSNLLIANLTRVGSNRVTAPEILQSCQAIVSYFATQIASIIPDWTNALTFNTDGSGAGAYCKYPDTNGIKRIFETKTSGNINNVPPSDPGVHETTHWLEVSASESAAIPEWSPGIYGPGLIIVFHNHSVDGRGLYVLIEPARPYNSVNIEAEITALKWELISGGGGSGTVLSVTGTVVDNTDPSNPVINADPAGAATTAENNAKSYADSIVVGLWDDRGNFDASVNSYPSSGGSGPAGARRKGDIWTISVAGTLPTGQVVEPGDTVRALVDNASNTQADWSIQQNNIGYTAENSANKSTSVVTDQASNTKYPSVKSVYDWAVSVFQTLAAKDATGGYAGLTLFKINFKNVANTFTSFFTNANTAARTYTFQDRNGTIADDTDLALKAPLASPALTGTPTAPTASASTNTTQVATTAFVIRATVNTNLFMYYNFY